MDGCICKPRVNRRSIVPEKLSLSQLIKTLSAFVPPGHSHMDSYDPRDLCTHILYVCVSRYVCTYVCVCDLEENYKRFNQNNKWLMFQNNKQ